MSNNGENPGNTRAGMTHSFDIGHAAAYGLIEAVLIQNLSFWIVRNRANGVNLREGRTWTYNTVTAFGEIFPYLTRDQIRYSLGKLINAGVLLDGNYNERAADRTKWYAFADESAFLPDPAHLGNLANGLRKNPKADLGNLPNGSGTNRKSVNKTDVNGKCKPDGGDAQRGTRLAADWTLPKSWGDWALAEFTEQGWTEDYVRKVADKFRDHWIAKPGKDGRKSDWPATWRNWCRGEPAPRKEGSAAGGSAWFDTASGIEAKGREMGITAMPGESMPSLKARIYDAIENGGKPPAPKPSRLPQAYTPLGNDVGPSGKDAPIVQNALSQLKHLTKARSKSKDEPQ